MSLSISLKYSITSLVINFPLYCVEEVLDWEDENDLSKKFWLSIKGSLKEKGNLLCTKAA